MNTVGPPKFDNFDAVCPSCSFRSPANEWAGAQRNVSGSWGPKYCLMCPTCATMRPATEVVVRVERHCTDCAVKDTRLRHLGMKLHQHEHLMEEILERMDSEEHPAAPIELVFSEEGMICTYRCAWCGGYTTNLSGQVDPELGRKHGWHEAACLYIRARYLMKGF